MEWLDPPYQFFHPEPGLPFILRVVRYEVGQAMREVDDPPRTIVRTTIRFHLPGPGGWGLRPYVDFTNRGLMLRVVDIYNELIDRWLRRPEQEGVKVLEATSPVRGRPLPLELTRRGRGLDTMYEVKVLEVA